MTAQEQLRAFESIVGDPRTFTPAKRLEYHRLLVAVIEEQEHEHAAAAAARGMAEGVKPLTAAQKRSIEAREHHLSGALPLDAECERISQQNITKQNNTK